MRVVREKTQEAVKEARGCTHFLLILLTLHRAPDRVLHERQRLGARRFGMRQFLFCHSVHRGSIYPSAHRVECVRLALARIYSRSSSRTSAAATSAMNRCRFTDSGCATMFFSLAMTSLRVMSFP